MPKSRKRQNLTGLRVRPSSSAFDYKKQRYRPSVHGYVDKELPLGVLKHNTKGENPRFVDDFSKLPITKKNEVIKYFNDHPKAQKVYLLEPTGVKKSKSAPSTKKTNSRKPLKLMRWFGGKGKQYKASKSTTLARRGKNKLKF